MLIKVILKSIPVFPLLLILLCIPVMNWMLGDGAFLLVDHAFAPVSIPKVEILTNLAAIAVMALLVPTMSAVDMWRARAQRLALARYLSGITMVLIISVLAASSFQARFLKASEGALIQGLPESGLLVNNALLIAAFSACIIPTVGRLLGVPFSLLVWIAGLTPLYFKPEINLWPLDYFKQEGPWFSLPHIITTTSAVFVAAVIQYRTAGLSRKAAAFEKVHG